ncbi:hypothetical protein [Hypericibacter sp.]|uniref:hypothetical protein n=1 Tax=Hypericibacter sp. TaxID=2705401 RepID=UPI003D6CC86B
MKKDNPDVMLELPPVSEATANALGASFIATAKAMIRFGYPPDALARALIGIGASLAADVFGREMAARELETAAGRVRALPPDDPLDAPSAGRA